MTIRIEQERGHYVVYVEDKFFCSADTFHEAIMELHKDKIET